MAFFTIAPSLKILPGLTTEDNAMIKSIKLNGLPMSENAFSLNERIQPLKKSVSKNSVIQFGVIVVVVRLHVEELSSSIIHSLCEIA